MRGMRVNPNVCAPVRVDKTSVGGARSFRQACAHLPSVVIKSRYATENYAALTAYAPLKSSRAYAIVTIL